VLLSFIVHQPLHRLDVVQSTRTRYTALATPTVQDTVDLLPQSFDISAELLIQKIIDVALQPGTLSETIPLSHQYFILLLLFDSFQLELLKLVVKLVSFPDYVSIEECILIAYLLLQLCDFLVELLPGIVFMHQL